MSKRMFLVFVIITLLVIGVGFTTIESSSIQSDMSLFEDALTSEGGVTSTIDNSSALGDVALKIQSVIDLLLSAVMSFFNKIINLFT